MKIFPLKAQKHTVLSRTAVMSFFFFFLQKAENFQKVGHFFFLNYKSSFCMKSKREDLDIVLSDAPPFCCSNHLFPLGSNCNISSLVSSLQVTLCDTHKLFCFLFLAASCRICRMKAKMHHCYFSAFPMVRSQQQLEDKYTSKYLLPKLN